MTALVPNIISGTFQPLIGRLKDHAQSCNFTREEVRELVVGCGFGAALLEKLWEELQEALHRGVESQKLAFEVANVAQAIDLALGEVYPRIHQIASGEGLKSEEKLAYLRKLDGYRERALAMQKELVALQQLLEKPPTAGNEVVAILNSRLQTLEQYEDLDHILTQMRDVGK